MKKQWIFIGLVLVLSIGLLTACGKKTEEAVTTETASAEPTIEMSAAVSEEPRFTSEAPSVSREPSVEPTPEATPVPTVASTATPMPTAAPTPVPTVKPTATPSPTVAPTSTPVPTEAPVELRAGSWEAEDGSTLKLNSDGTVAYKTEVSGTVNGSAMSGMLTFSGIWDEEGFHFDKVVYGFIDLTEIAKANGLGDPTPWENAAMQMYREVTAD